MKPAPALAVRTVLCLFPATLGSAVAGEQQASLPIRVELRNGGGYASFVNQSHPGNRIGYRFFEHTPLVFGTVPQPTRAADTARAEAEASRWAMLGRPGTVVCRQEVPQADQWTRQSWQILMVPAADGIDLLWLIETHDQGLPAYYGVQQCFRLGGTTNQSWRRAIAETPAFSEFDLWKSQKRRWKVGLWHLLGARLPCHQPPSGRLPPLDRKHRRQPAQFHACYPR